MIKTAYGTTVAGNYRLDKIIVALEKAILSNDLAMVKDGSSKFPLYIVTGENTDVPSFSHTISFELVSREGQIVFVIDGRPFVRPSEDGYSVKEQSDYLLNVIRSRIEMHCLSEDNDAHDLYTLGDVPMWVMIRWLSTQLAGRLGLDPESEIRLAVVIACHYLSMHGVKYNEDDNSRAKYATRIARVTGYTVAMIVEVMSGITNATAASLPALVQNAMAVIDSARIEKLTAALIIQVATGTSGWRGTQSREVVGVGLEHAPTWHAMTFLAIDQATYRRSQMAELINKKYRDKQGIKSYTRSMVDVLRIG